MTYPLQPNLIYFLFHKSAASSHYDVIMRFFWRDLFQLLKDTHYGFDPDDDPDDPDWVEEDKFEPEEVREDSGKAPYIGKDNTHWHANQTGMSTS